jgi:hypothetical protein
MAEVQDSDVFLVGSVPLGSADEVFAVCGESSGIASSRYRNSTPVACGLGDSTARRSVLRSVSGCCKAFGLVPE